MAVAEWTGRAGAAHQRLAGERRGSRESIPQGRHEREETSQELPCAGVDRANAVRAGWWPAFMLVQPEVERHAGVGAALYLGLGEQGSGST